MARIQSFHLQLIARYRSCLVNRLARINAFALKMRQRATSFVHNIVPDSWLLSKRRLTSSNVSTNDFMLVRNCQKNSKLSSINTDLNSKDKFKLMFLLSKLKLMLPSKKLLK